VSRFKLLPNQHGLLVARDEGVYSFSHLTIQEYLTALHVVERNLGDDLVSNYLFDRNWREVFILVAGIRQPDQLLLAMEGKVHGCMNTEKLQDLLDWVARIVNPEWTYITPVGKRAMAITNAISYADAISYSDIKINSDSFSISLTNAIDCNRNDITASLIITQGIASIIVNTKTNLLEYSKADSLMNFWRIVRDSYNGIINMKVDSLAALTATIQLFQQEISSGAQSFPFQVELDQEIIRIWLQAIDLSLEMLCFSGSERDAIDDYLYAIKLLIDCRQAAARVDLQVWEAIESRLLIPHSAFDARLSSPAK
jgi:hypothetical protein